MTTAESKPVAVITGASRGIGAETAVEFARRGYDLTLTARSVDALNHVTKRVAAAGGRALVVPGDLADIAMAEKVIRDTVDHYHRLDVLINNAAWREVLTMRNLTLESWERTLRVCLTTPAFMSRWAAVQMEKQKKGVIINVSSIQSELAGGYGTAYIAAKGAMDSLTFDLAALYGPSGVRVVAINPGAIDTEIGNDYTDEAGETASIRSREFSYDMIPLRRWGTAQEVAKAMAWMAGDDASYLTGTTVVFDGGWSHQISPYSLKHLIFPKEFR